MIVTVVYPHDTEFEINVPDSVACSRDAILGFVWEETQGDMSEIRGTPSQLEELRKQGKRLRSSMVGDVFKFRGSCYVVNGTGFVEIKPEALEEYLKIPQVDQIMGWKWVTTHAPNPRVFVSATLIQ